MLISGNLMRKSVYRIAAKGYNGEMKKILIILFLFVLTGCDTWGTPPQPFPVWTLPPSATPHILSPTPAALPPPGTIFPTLTIISPGIETTSPTLPPSATLTPVPPTQVFTQAPIQSIAIDILGCNTGIDILNGMGEVTNAYITLKNTGSVDLPNACGLLRAIDESARAHPDKKVCVPNLPAQHQVILKLTVDSTYQQNTIIQVDALSNDVVLLRIDKESCRDINIFGGAPSNVGVIQPIQP